LSNRHTRKWFRQELSFPSAVIDRGSCETWQQAGAKHANQRAEEQTQVLVQQYSPNSLSEQQRADLREITSNAAQQFGMDTLPTVEEIGF
jgi:trimethylamine:corrinoid methyltransferase-like protein